MRIAERREDPSASPFGLVFQADSDRDLDGFPGWRYQPDYFEAGMSFVVGASADQFAEPLVVVMPANLPTRPPQQLSPAPFVEVTSLIVNLPGDERSATLDYISMVDRVDLRTADRHWLTIEFGNCAIGQQADPSADLPLTVSW